MASVNVPLSGNSTSNGKPLGKSLENGILTAASEKLDLRETEEVLSDELDTPDELDEEEPPMGEIKEDLDALTSSGSAINDLEMKLTRTKAQYRRTLNEAREKLDAMRRRLGNHIKKSEPFIEIWRKARQIQEQSNKAAARFDKANSQHMAAKEMIRMSESQLSKVNRDEQDPSSPSPIDLAWQEMLNHATTKVVDTEKERRESEIEHRHIMEECTRIMEEYKNTEKKLRSHIIKSRPYYEERYQCNQRLQQMRLQMQTLETRIAASKKTYATALKKLEVLNTEIHRKRQYSISQRMNRLDSRKSLSTGNSPEPMRTRLDVRMRERGGSGNFVGSGSVSLGGASDTESVSSLQLGDLKDQFSGSTGSLPSIGTSSISEVSPSPSPTPEPPNDEDRPITIECKDHKATDTSNGHIDEVGLPCIEVNSDPVAIEDECRTPTAVEPHLDPVETMANKLVQQTLATAVDRIEKGHGSSSPSLNPLTSTTTANT